MTRRYYQGPPDKQPKDCGRRHPQPLCMCVLCEVAARFASITKLQRQRDLVQALRDIDASETIPEDPPRGRVHALVIGSDLTACGIRATGEGRFDPGLRADPYRCNRCCRVLGYSPRGTP